MARWLLNLAYLATLIAALPLLLYRAARERKDRRGLLTRFLGRIPSREGDRPAVWFHAVSVGEVNLLAPLIERWQARHPGWDCIVSTTTEAGYALAREKYAAHHVCRFPLDFSWAVDRALHALRPKLLVLAELEVWPNLIDAAQRRGVPVAVVNGRLSERSFRGYRRLAPLVRSTFASLDLVAAQDADYAARFVALGTPKAHVQVTGSIKFNGARMDRHHSAAERLGRLAGFAAGDLVWLAGSTQAPEESLVLAVFASLAERWPRLRLVIVPRHPHRFDDVASLLAARCPALGLSWQRRSVLDDGPSDSSINKPPAAPPRVLLVDSVGELGHWWATAQIGFVGGSLGSRGGQNMIEPAAYGVATCFGPNTRNFRQIVELLRAADAAVVVEDAAELRQFVEHCLTDPEFARGLGQRARALVARQQGAADRTIDLLSALGARGTASASAHGCARGPRDNRPSSAAA